MTRPTYQIAEDRHTGAISVQRATYAPLAPDMPAFTGYETIYAATSLADANGWLDRELAGDKVVCTSPPPRPLRWPLWLDFTSAALAIAWALVLFAVVNACTSALGFSQFTSGFVASVVTALLGAFLWVAMKALMPRVHRARWTVALADEARA
jgi:hypothetical protein